MMIFRHAVLLLLVVALCGCSSGSNGVTLDANGNHPSGWVGSNGGNHAAAYLAAPEQCQECHGGDLLGGISKVSCSSADRNGVSCHAQGPGIHPAGWALPAAHGARAKAEATGSDGMDFCRNCHGTDLRGAGVVGKDCLRCHVTAPHPPKPWTGATRTHASTDPSNAPACAPCHNAATTNLSSSPIPYQARFAPAGSFNGGTAGCFNGALCHADVTRTTDCNGCHGPLSATRFNSLAGVTAETDSKVGAHIRHLHATIGSTVACAECHQVPAAPARGGTHRDGTTQIVFGTLATGNGTLVPLVGVSGGAVTCANTYCHGASLTGGGSNKVPAWNQTNYNAGCGTCHGFPPTSARNGAAGHSSSTACNSCHTHVNSTNDGFTAAGVALHVNGSVEAAVGGGHGGAPYPGSSHKGTSTAGCFGCHPANAAGSTYPAGSGTPPNCRGCHLDADPTTDPHCSDCHGDAATGRPLLSSTLQSDFPRRRGQHRNGSDKHSNLACTVCHPFTSGDPRHGWSNRQKSTSAQINTNIGWDAATKTCTSSCHERKRWY